MVLDMVAPMISDKLLSQTSSTGLERRDVAFGFCMGRGHNDKPSLRSRLGVIYIRCQVKIGNAPAYGSARQRYQCQCHQFTGRQLPKLDPVKETLEKK